MNVYISVTQKDIDKGIRKDCGKCPLGLAISRILKPTMANWPVYVEVKSMVEIGFTRLYHGKEQNIIQSINGLNITIVRWINDFDKGLPVKPFILILDLPEKMIAGLE